MRSWKESKEEPTWAELVGVWLGEVGPGRRDRVEDGHLEGVVGVRAQVSQEGDL